MEQDLPIQPDQGLGVIQEAGRQADSLGGLVPGHSEEVIFVDRRHLWNSFFAYSLSVRRRLVKHLAILHAIQEASPSSSAVTNASEGNRFTQFLRSRFRWFRAPLARKYPVVEPDRVMLKITKDVAVSDLGHMIDLLEIARMLPKPTRPPFSLRLGLWIVGCSALSTLAPHEFVAHLLRQGAAQGAAVGVMSFLEPLVRDLFFDYNVDCLEKELRGLKRDFMDGTISEKNRGAMDSWHMNARSSLR